VTAAREGVGKEGAAAEETAGAIEGAAGTAAAGAGVTAPTVTEAIDSPCECEHNNPDSLDARLFSFVVLAVAPAVTMDEASSLSARKGAAREGLGKEGAAAEGAETVGGQG